MITEWLIQVATGLWSFIAGLFPDWVPPASITDVANSVNGLFTLAQGLGPFVDWTAVGLLAAIPPGIWVTGILVKAALKLISHIPLFGGNG